MNDVVEKITEEIKRKGAMPLARFMELALYCPECGYYEKEKDNIGRRGDFYTSVSVGSLFGQLLAFQFAQWLTVEEKRKAKSEKRETLPAASSPSPPRSGDLSRLGSGERNVGEATGPRGPSERERASQQDRDEEVPRLQRESSLLKIVEAGAHDARLARDILQWLHQRQNDLFEKLEYWIVEPSARRREWQRESLADFHETVRWTAEIAALEQSLQSSRAVIFSNELLDAMPLLRLVWDAKTRKWVESGVAFENGRFAWSPVAEGEIHVSRFMFHGIDVEKLSGVLPDGFTLEISPAAERWWREAAGVLKNGKLLTIDYGLTAEEFFAPEHKDGTLRAYRAHHFSNDVLANPGEQDITAHVNFSAIQSAGEAAGLQTDVCVSQAKFLTGIAEQTWKHPDIFGEWTAAQTRQFQTLAHPEHLGRPFRVLVQSRLAERLPALD